MKRYLALALAVSGMFAAKASAQSPGNLTLNELKLLANGNAITLQAPPTLGSNQTFSFPDQTGVTSPSSFIVTESPSLQSINTGGLQVLDVGIMTNNLTIANGGQINMNGQKITNLALPTAASDAVNQSFVVSNFALKNGNASTNFAALALSVSGGLNMNNQRIVNVATPVAGTDGVNRDYVLLNYAVKNGNPSNDFSAALLTATAIRAQAITMNGSLDANSNRIINLPTPTAGTDAVNQSFVVNNFAQKNGSSVVNFAAQDLSMSGTLNMNSQRIINLGSPLTGTDGVNRDFVTTFFAPKNGSSTNDFAVNNLTVYGQLGGSLDANNHSIFNIPDVPAGPTDAVNVTYVNSSFASKNGSPLTDFSVRNLVANGTVDFRNASSVLMASLDMGSARITNLAIPSAGSDAATKTYVDVVAASDVRFKKQIAPLTEGLHELEQMNPVTYHFRTEDFPDRYFPSTPEVGFIAQEMEKVVPEVVITNADGYKMINYGHLAPVIVNAIKEQQQMIEKQQQQLQSKDQELLTLRSELSSMKNEMQEMMLAIAKLARPENVATVK